MKNAIVMAGCAADAAAVRAIEEMRGELLRAFPSFFCEGPLRGESLDRILASSMERTRAAHDILCGQGRTAVRLGRGGVLKGLWTLGETLACGMEAELRAIPVRQEVIELCEYLGLDPYYADSEGAFLIAAPDAVSLVRELQKKEIPAAIIGTLTDDRARILNCPGHTRYLDKPRAYL